MMGVVVGRVRGIGRGHGVEGWGHEAKNQMQSDGSEGRHAVDIAVEYLSREEKERSVEDDVEQRAIEIAVVHEVLIDASKGIKHG